jgi:UDPglucose 6-dehydrogenase
MRSLIAGYGVVGQATAAAIVANGFDPPAVLDPAVEGCGPIDDGPRRLVFVCVPTNEGLDGAADLSQVDQVIDNALQRAKAEGNHPASPYTIVIRSTVPPGTTSRLQQQHPEAHILFVPEFLTEATAQQDALHPPRLIIGHTPQSVQDGPVVGSMLAAGGDSRHAIYVPATVAELSKYASNCFYATKVAFFNQLYELCGKLGIDYEMLRYVVALDPMIAPSHLDVHHRGYRGYGGKCLPKDAKALLTAAWDLKTDLTVLEAADKYNDELTRRQPAPAAGDGPRTDET